MCLAASIAYSRVVYWQNKADQAAKHQAIPSEKLGASSNGANSPERELGQFTHLDDEDEFYSKRGGGTSSVPASLKLA